MLGSAVDELKAQKSFVIGSPELPDIDNVQQYMKKIWISRSVTNFGSFFKTFEARLQDYLNADNLVLFSSGTSALEALVQIIKEKNSAYLAGYSFAATLSAVRRNNICPTFIDVNEGDGNIDEKNIPLEKIKDQDFILGVHSYGFACNMEALDKISKEHQVPVIFDAAHAVGAKYDKEHLVNFGLASIISLHATKILSSVEGGAVITADKNLAEELRNFRNFGIHTSRSGALSYGTNAKMSELHAAIGLLQLQDFDKTLNRRVELFHLYVDAVKKLPGFRMLSPRDNSQPNGSYVPLFMDAFEYRGELLKFLEANNIYAKPYFNTSLAKLDQNVSGQVATPVSERLSQGSVCLPIHSQMTKSDIELIAEKVHEFSELNQL